MPRSRTAGFAAGVLAALLWSPHFYVVRHFLAGAEEVNVLVFYLYVVFWGAVDVQAFLPRATQPEVVQTVLDLVDTLGDHGGYVMAPAHNMQEDIPPENIIAWIETIKG